jgi:hypothetical protein
MMERVAFPCLFLCVVVFCHFYSISSFFDAPSPGDSAVAIIYYMRRSHAAHDVWSRDGISKE